MAFPRTRRAFLPYFGVRLARMQTQNVASDLWARSLYRLGREEVRELFLFYDIAFVGIESTVVERLDTNQDFLTHLHPEIPAYPTLPHSCSRLSRFIVCCLALSMKVSTRGHRFSPS